MCVSEWVRLGLLEFALLWKKTKNNLVEHCLFNKHEWKVGICMISLSPRNCVCDLCESMCIPSWDGLVYSCAVMYPVHCTAGFSTVQVYYKSPHLKGVIEMATKW